MSLRNLVVASYLIMPIFAHTVGVFGVPAHISAAASKTTHSTAKVTESTHSPENVTESTHSTENVTESTHSPENVTESTHSPENVTTSTLSSANVTEYTHSPENVTTSSFSPSNETESTNSQGILSEIREQLKGHDDHVDWRLRGINKTLATQINDVKRKLVQIEAKLDRVLQLSSQTFSQANCKKGGGSLAKSRERFMLWGKYPVLCDTETDGGGWVIIQRRTKGDVKFSRGWSAYKKGFRTPDTDYWLGLDNIHNLTSQGYTQLRVDVQFDGREYFALYTNFSVADEASKYQLNVGKYSGTAGDGLTYHNGMYFSTFDRDNDNDSANCAAFWISAWWFNSCHYSNLNGVWGAEDFSGMAWNDTIYPGSVSFSEMKVRYV